MDNEKKRLLKEKLDIQKAKSMLKCIDGICVLDIFEIGKNPGLSEISMKYFKVWKNYGVSPKKRLSVTSSLTELCEWIIEATDIMENKEYYFLCGGLSIQVWARIRIIELHKAIENILKNTSYSLFLVDTITNKVYDVSCDSSDEYNYLMYIWSEN